MAGGADVWEPRSGPKLDRVRLDRLVEMAARVDLEDIAGSLTVDEISDGAALMKLPADDWDVAGELPDEEVVALIRFFTLAEMQLTGWDGGKDSPVIPLVRILKARGTFDEALRKWIKHHTDNRYLPYGSAL